MCNHTLSRSHAAAYRKESQSLVGRTPLRERTPLRGSNIKSRINSVVDEQVGNANFETVATLLKAKEQTPPQRTVNRGARTDPALLQPLVKFDPRVVPNPRNIGVAAVKERGETLKSTCLRLDPDLRRQRQFMCLRYRSAGGLTAAIHHSRS